MCTHLANGLDFFLDLDCWNWSRIDSSWRRSPNRAASSSIWFLAAFLSFVIALNAWTLFELGLDFVLRFEITFYDWKDGDTRSAF